VSQIEILTESLGGAPLARLAVAGDPAISGWYARLPSSSAEWGDRVRALREESAARDWRAALGDAFGAAGGAAKVRLERVVRGRGLVVTTGQQPGLFGGAILAWTKALSALALADAIEAETGVPTAPIFWAATDDADFDEASVTTVAAPGGIDVLRMRRADSRPGTPMSHEPLGDVEPLLNRLAAGTGSAAYAPALALLREAYLSPGATVGSAFVHLLRGVLGPLGIPVIDASHPDARRAMYPIARLALERADAVSEALRARDEALRSAGHQPQVENDPSMTVVFRTVRGVKERVPVERASLVAREASPGELSGNVLLRPVIERAILPTAAYVAGPAEIAYFAQATAVADALGLTRPLAVPRWSGTIVEPHVRRILDRLRVAPTELAAPQALEGRLVKSIAEQEGAWRTDALREAVDRAAGPLFAAAAELPADAMPRSVIEGALRAIAHRLDRLDRRYLAGLKRREAALLRDVRAAAASLYPGGVRQERVLNFVTLLARHGVPLVDALRAATSAHGRDLVGAGRRASAGVATASA